MDISVNDLKGCMDSGDIDFVFIDVCELVEYEVFNIGGIFILVGIIVGVLDELEEYCDKEVIVYCWLGVCSGMV